MRIGVALSLVLLVSACGPSSSKPETPLHVSTFELQSKLLDKQFDQVLVTPQGGGKGRPLLRRRSSAGASAWMALQMVKVTGFMQRSPHDGAGVSEQTEAYLGYDEKNLYAVFVCFDDPRQVRARMSRREDIHDDDQCRYDGKALRSP